MRVLVPGASGATGQHLVKQLLAGGHDVTAFARDPASVTVRDPRLRIVEGEARDAASFDRAMAGHDAVVSAFGPRSFRRDDLQEVFMRNLVAAMTHHGVARLVNLSGWGAGESLATTSFGFRTILVPLVLGRFFADKERGEALLFASPLDYVNVRPGRLTNRPARGGVKASPTGVGLRPVMAREDLARFMIDQLAAVEWIRRSPVIGY